ncbi:T9SS type A sorting domain-containing protein [candidate division KSB1 bacterium]|nr:T9SS type A sorting domain-containing protein [candidate division KSB1 bacterium]
MKFRTKSFALILLALLVTFTVMANAEPVKVRLLANTAAVPDTLGPTSVVQIRGAGGPLTWDGGSVFMENIEGDYWTATLDLEPGTNLEFKFYTHANDTVYAGADWEHQGWEGDLTGGNRALTVGDSDTTLPLQFVNGWKNGAEQYEKPFDTNDSTFVVYIRVNMQGWEDFNPANHVVGIRGSNTSDWGQTGELSWGPTYLLSQENDHPNGGSQQYNAGHFYSGPVHVPAKYAGTGVKFKAVVHNAGADLGQDWGDMVYNPDLEMEVPISGADTTLHWFWFDNLRPVTADHQDTVIVTFNADLSDAIVNKGFSHGDTIQVRSGYFGTAAETKTKMMLRQGFSNVYSATDTILTTIGEPLDYQYYKIKNGAEYREVYYNFLYEGDTAGEAERRVVESIASNEITVNDDLASTSEIHRMPLFRNTSVIQQDVLLTVTCDIRPAIYQVLAGATLEDIQSNRTVTDADSIIAWGVAINGPLTGDWGTWGPALLEAEGRNEKARKMFDDGTNGDEVAGDSIYTIQYMFYKDSTDVVGQEFKFGIGGGDNEGGYGNNHIENIDDTQSTATINAQFGSIDPVFYSAWNFDTQSPTTAVTQKEGTVPTVYSLDQNYPNPFNPSTHIHYTLPKTGLVKLTVFNILGKEIATLVNKKQTAGAYDLSWNGLDDQGRQVSSGVYFYRMQASDFIQTRKMMFIK